MNIELTEQDMDLVIEALIGYIANIRESLDAYYKSSEITKIYEPEFVNFMDREITRLNELYEQFFSTRYKIEGV